MRDNHIYRSKQTGEIWRYHKGLLWSDYYIVELDTLSQDVLTLCPPAKWEIWDTASSGKCTCGAAHTEFNTLHSTWCDYTGV